MGGEELTFGGDNKNFLGSGGLLRGGVQMGGETINKTTCRIPPPSKSSPTMGTLIEKLSNCCDYFLRLSGFPDLSGKVFLITFQFS